MGGGTISLMSVNSADPAPPTLFTFENQVPVARSTPVQYLNLQEQANLANLMKRGL
jgi:hypothetical protein